jgi:ribosome maturation factor RimP
MHHLNLEAPHGAFFVNAWSGFANSMSRLMTELQSLLGDLVEDLGYKLWALQLLGEGGSKKLRLFIDQPDFSGDIGLEDCETVSREVAALLDVNDPIPGHYTLEVSSPGVDRPLFEPEHFRLCLAQDVDIKTFSKVEGRHRHHGRLLAVDDTSITLQRDDDLEMSLPHAEIRSAKLAPDYAQLLAGQTD